MDKPESTNHGSQYVKIIEIQECRNATTLIARLFDITDPSLVEDTFTIRVNKQSLNISNEDIHSICQCLEVIYHIYDDLNTGNVMPERERTICQTLINAVLENEINEEQFNSIYADEITPRISQEEIDAEILECKKNLIMALRELLGMGVSEILCEAGFWKQPRNTTLKVKEMLGALIATQEVIQNPAEPLWMTGQPQLHLPDYVKNGITFH